MVYFYVQFCFLSLYVNSHTWHLAEISFCGDGQPPSGRRLVGPNHKLLLPTTALVGALVIVIADTLTRTISFGADIPTGIIITILVTPYFLYLLSKAG
ncbi:iron chelate uptake ABC transporter family permease subunit [Paenibacillus farraposensis]|uniref:iron chelate uptake ABC transporter family permease subunit n=1 Tax=Paenibacillus farraposensis TaxID=2807095 RepID=UPI00360A3CD3